MTLHNPERRVLMSKHVSWNLPLAVFLGITMVQLVQVAEAQVTPSARGGNNLPLVIGGGVSDYSLDWGPGQRMLGVTAWADWDYLGHYHFLRGVGIEAEGTDLNFDRPANIPRMRHDTGEGGVTYTLRRFRNLAPYAKLLVGIGSIDFPASPAFPNYTHDTFLVFSPGGGAEYRIYPHVWLRADYEYQFWNHTFGPHDLNPNGITVGATYHFGFDSR
jgi:opacity protein-like surface antigen